MGLGYGISGIGNYASDPYFNYAYGSYNPNFMAAMSASAQQAAAAQTTAQTGASSASGSAQTVTNPTSDVSFQGSDKEKSSSSGNGTGLLVGGGVVAGAATLLYAAKKGNGAGIKAGFKKIWNSIKEKVKKATDLDVKEVNIKVKNVAPQKQEIPNK